MASRIPNNLPRIPLGAIIGGVGAIGATAGAGYLAYHSVYNGNNAAAVVVAELSRCVKRMPFSVWRGVKV